MMKPRKAIFSFFVLAFFSIQTLLAQTAPLTNSSQNPSGEAAAYQAMIVLSEETIDASANPVTVKEHRIVKLLSPQAVQRYSRVLEFSYVAPDQNWTINSVQITTTDGKVQTVDLTSAKAISPLEKFPPFNNVKILFLPLPNLQPGDTLEYTATYSDKMWIPGQFWQEIYLQDQDPIQKETVSLIEKNGSQAQVVEVNGTLPAALSTKQTNTTTRTWEWDNIPAFPDLQNVLSAPPVADLAPRLVVTSLTNWQDVARGVEGAFLTPSGDADLNKIVSKYLSGITGKENLLRATYSFVDQGIRSLPLQIGGDFGKIPHPLDYETIVKQGLGDSRDKAALLSALLKQEGFDPELALISTASHGDVDENLPEPGIFNRMLVRLNHNGKIFWFDPYVENCPFGYLPPEDQGRKALLLETGELVDTPVFPPSANERDVDVQAQILPNGSLVQTMNITANGSDSIAMRTLLRSVAPEQRQQIISALADQIAADPKIDQVSLSAVDDLTQPITIGLKFEAKHYAMSAGDLYILSLPFNISSDLEAIANQPAQRKYPFLLGTTTKEVRNLELIVPKGYKLRYIPKGGKLSNLAGSYVGYFKPEKGKLIFESTFILNKPVLSPTQFLLLQALVGEKLKVEGEKVVLQKIKG